MKIGRNAPCPCGSEKKYKKCCLGKENVSNRLLWQRLSEAYNRLVDRLLAYAQRTMGTDGFIDALDEFFLWPVEVPGEDTLAEHEQLFFPWYLFNWVQEPDEEEEELAPALGETGHLTLAAAYKQAKGTKLDPIEQRLIDAIEGEPFSFYEIVDCEPGQSYQLKDLFMGTVTHVVEKKGSQKTRKGDLLFGRIATVDAMSMLYGSGTIIISPSQKPYLIDIRKWLMSIDNPVTKETLVDYDFDLRETYMDLYQAQIGQIIETHWKHWIDEQIPALGGITPHQAVKTADGRESVEALLLDAVRNSAYTGPMQAEDKKAIEDVRRRLGLNQSKKIRTTRQHHEAALAIRIDSIKKQIEDFGRKHLTTEYTNFALNLCDKISLTPDLNIHRGKKPIWAAAIVYVIARLNFLFDMEGDLVLTPALICAHFDTVKSTVANKASRIQKACDLFYGAKGFCRQEIVDSFTFYETPDGFIVPKKIAERIETEEKDKPENPAMRILEYRRKQEQRTQKADALRKERQKASRTKTIIQEDDKQLKLFDD